MLLSLAGVCIKYYLLLPQVTESSPEFRWDRGTRGVASVDCDPSLASEQPHPPGTPGLDLTDVERVRAELGKHRYMIHLV